MLGRGKDVSASLEGFCSLLVPLCQESSLLILTDFPDHLVIEVLDDVKEIKNRLDVGTTVLKCFLEVTVHVAGDRLNPVHPILSNMLDERVYRGFLLSVGEPQYVAGLHVYDDHRILVPVMELELIDAQEPGLPLGLDEALSVDGVLLFQTLQVDVLDGIPTEAGDIRNLLVGKAIGEQVPSEGQQFAADAVALCLERDVLHVAVPASGTIIAQLGEPETTQFLTEAQVPQIHLTAVVDVH